jgi:hypothetical protein
VSYFSPDVLAPRTASPSQELQRCPDCRSDLVYPYDWDDTDERGYELTLRCPNCEWTHVGTYDWDAVRRLDERLDAGERSLMADLAALSRANVEDDFERFIAALRAGHVWPMDF